MNRAIYEKKRTALLIVDPYNDFISEGGKLYAITKPTADSVGYYENMRKLIPATYGRLWVWPSNFVISPEECYTSYVWPARLESSMITVCAT